MTRDEAALLEEGDKVKVRGWTYTFKRWEEEAGDVVVYNSCGSPAPCYFAAKDCELVEPLS